MKYAVYIVVIFALLSCNSNTDKEAEMPIAIAGEKQLKKSEYLKFNFLSNAVNDSLYISKKLIENWAKDELFYQEAKQKLLPEDLNVEEEVERYRKELINYRYEIKLIENNIDTIITKEEVQAYYDANRDNFILKDNIAKVNYFKIPLASKALDKIKKSIYSQNPKDKEVLKSLCLQYADNYFINDSTWLLLEDIKKEVLNKLTPDKPVAGCIDKALKTLPDINKNAKEALDKTLGVVGAIHDIQAAIADNCGINARLTGLAKQLEDCGLKDCPPPKEEASTEISNCVTPEMNEIQDSACSTEYNNYLNTPAPACDNNLKETFNKYRCETELNYKKAKTKSEVTLAWLNCTAEQKNATEASFNACKAAYDAAKAANKC